MSADATQQDWYTRSMFEPRGQSREEVVGGLVAVFCALVVLPATVWGTSAAVDAARDALGAEEVVAPEEEELPPLEIVEARARTGQDVLRRVLETDEGAARLGEVALVPYSSPISQSGLLFYNTLFDENAASHIALGQAYSKCFVDGGKLSEDELRARGANRSLIHIDWMIGSDEIDVDGLDSIGVRTPVMRQGEFAL